MEAYKEKVDKAIIGQFYNVDNIINEDCDLYDIKTGDLVFSFKKKKIPDELYDIDKKLIAHSKSLSYNRGSAGGVVLRIIINILHYLSMRMVEYLKEQEATLYHLRALVVSIRVLSIPAD
mgnify:CR=1 FL=1